jgi:tRNA modification GTPase
VGDQEAAILQRLPDIPRLTVHNKIDLADEAPRVSADGNELWLSAKSGAGMDLLRQRLLELAGWSSQGEGVFIARARHLDALRRAGASLEGARNAGKQLEFFAEELRLGQEALSEITGEFGSDDLLGVIFSQFCIGK